MFFRASLIFLNAAVISFLNFPRTGLPTLSILVSFHWHGRDVFFCSWHTPTPPTSKRAYYGTSTCTSFLGFPALDYSPQTPVTVDRDKLLEADLFASSSEGSRWRILRVTSHAALFLLCTLGGAAKSPACFSLQKASPTFTTLTRLLPRPSTTSRIA